MWEITRNGRQWNERLIFSRRDPESLCIKSLNNATTEYYCYDCTRITTNLASLLHFWQPMMEVIAPADLQEGYQFEAEIGGQSFTVAVPLGGVEMGQKFLVPFHAQGVRPTTNVPVGAWKDSILDCCSYGPCHNHFCVSWWCVPRKWNFNLVSCMLRCMHHIHWHSLTFIDIHWHSLTLIDLWNVSRKQQSPLVKSFRDSSWLGMQNQDPSLKPLVHFITLPVLALFTGPFSLCPTFSLVFIFLTNHYLRPWWTFWLFVTASVYCTFSFPFIWYGTSGKEIVRPIFFVKYILPWSNTYSYIHPQNTRPTKVRHRRVSHLSCGERRFLHGIVLHPPYGSTDSPSHGRLRHIQFHMLYRHRTAIECAGDCVDLESIASPLRQKQWMYHIRELLILAILLKTTYFILRERWSTK